MKMQMYKNALRGMHGFWLSFTDLFSDIKNGDWKEAKYSAYRIYHSVTLPFRITYRQIKCILSYLPILWHDRDYDYNFLLYLMRHKLTRMEKCIRNGHHTRRIADANDIKSALFLLEQMMENTPEKEAFALHEKLWGESDMEFIAIEGSENFEMKITHEKVKTKEDEVEERKHFRHVIKNAEKRHQANFDKFFRMLAKRLRYWWS